MAEALHRERPAHGEAAALDGAERVDDASRTRRGSSDCEARVVSMARGVFMSAWRSAHGRMGGSCGAWRNVESTLHCAGSGEVTALAS